MSLLGFNLPTEALGGEILELSFLISNIFRGCFLRKIQKKFSAINAPYSRIWLQSIPSAKKVFFVFFAI